MSRDVILTNPGMKGSGGFKQSTYWPQLHSYAVASHVRSLGCTILPYGHLLFWTGIVGLWRFGRMSTLLQTARGVASSDRGTRSLAHNEWNSTGKA
jgi:hypothetical protein